MVYTHTSITTVSGFQTIVCFAGEPPSGSMAKGGGPGPVPQGAPQEQVSAGSDSQGHQGPTQGLLCGQQGGDPAERADFPATWSP